MLTATGLREGFRVALELAGAADRSADVQKLLAAQKQAFQLLEENEAQRVRIAELEERLATTAKLKRRGFAYYVAEEDGTETGPVCPACFRGDCITSRLVEAYSDGGGTVFCQRCQETYTL